MRESEPRKLMLKRKTRPGKVETTGIVETWSLMTGHTYMRPGSWPLLRTATNKEVEDGLNTISDAKTSALGGGGLGSWFSVWGIKRKGPRAVSPFAWSTE